jgi:hypothetical protein
LKIYRYVNLSFKSALSIFKSSNYIIFKSILPPFSNLQIISSSNQFFPHFQIFKSYHLQIITIFIITKTFQSMTPRSLLIFVFAILLGSRLNAQLERGVSIIQAGGGWSSVIISSNAETANGYMINGSYENWLAAPVGIGGSIHYMHVRKENDRGTSWGTSLPVYLDARYYFGKSRLRIFVIGSAGFQFSWRKLESTTGSGNEGSDHDAGFTAGFGTGLAYNINPGILLNLNYNLYWMKNAYYSNGIVNTVSLNVGFILGK